MVECAVEPPSEAVDVREGEPEDEVEQVADGVLVVGVSPEEQPASVQAIPRFVFREDFELAMGGVDPAVAFQKPHFAVTPRILALFIWVYAHEPPVVTNLTCIVPGMSVPPAINLIRISLIALCNHSFRMYYKCKLPYLPLHAFKLKSSSVHLLNSGELSC